jgi:uncharacterized protein
MGRMMRLAVLLLFASLTRDAAFATAPIPHLTSPITDTTRTLTASQIATLDQTLRAFSARKGAQVAVLIVPTVQPESIEQYSMRVAEAWKIGRKGSDDGVLFVVAKDDRDMRIDVGYGLEGALPDAIANRIIREDVAPHFRAGEFYLGIVAGTDRIMRIIDGEQLPAPSLLDRARKPSTDIGSSLPVLLVVALVIGGILRSIFGRFGGASLASIVVGFIVWLLVGTFAMAVIAAVVAFFITLVSGNSRGWGSRYNGGWGNSWGSGSTSSGWGGGGGGFGGGGASGKW